MRETTTSNLALEQKQLEALLASGIKIPPQPRILLEIDDMLQNPDFSIPQLTALISKDVGLTAAVFRIANSPGMGSARRVESLDEAVALLGTGPLVNMVKCSALRQALGGDAEVYVRFWEHATDMASLAAAIARKLRSVCNIFPDQAYAAGLFMDCGVPILMQRFPEYCQDYRASHAGGWPNLLEEDARIVSSHTAIGYFVARHWRLPDFIAVSIRDHHDEVPHGYAMRTMSCILLMAMHLRARHYQWPEDAEWLKYQAIVLEELGLSTAGLPEFEEDILEMVWGA